jgi:hypothetical protein
LFFLSYYYIKKSLTLISVSDFFFFNYGFSFLYDFFSALKPFDIVFYEHRVLKNIKIHNLLIWNCTRFMADTGAERAAGCLGGGRLGNRAFGWRAFGWRAFGGGRLGNDMLPARR